MKKALVLIVSCKPDKCTQSFFCSLQHLYLWSWLPINEIPAVKTMSHSLLFIYDQATLEQWTHKHSTITHWHTTHLCPMKFPLPPRAATNFSSTAPRKCRIYREKDHFTLITHTLLFLGRDGDCHSPDPDTAGSLCELLLEVRRQLAGLLC